jgi:hypothetical protein
MPWNWNSDRLPHPDLVRHGRRVVAAEDGGDVVGVGRRHLRDDHRLVHGHSSVAAVRGRTDARER